MEKDVYYTRVLPFARLTNEEIKSLPVTSAKMYWEFGDERYISEMPLHYKQGTSIKYSLVYLFDELSDEDQERFFDRTEILSLTREGTVKIYGEKSKGIHPKRRVKSRGEK